jgi:hypothetical protein
MAENGTKSIVFPATNVAGEAKLKRLVETIADYMGARVTIETVMVMQANFPSDRPDIEAIYKRLAGSKTGLNQVGRTVAPEATKITTPSEKSAIEKE